MRQCREFNVIETAYIMYSIKIITFEVLLFEACKTILEGGHWQIKDTRVSIPLCRAGVEVNGF